MHNPVDLQEIKTTKRCTNGKINKWIAMYSYWNITNKNAHYLYLSTRIDLEVIVVR